MAARIALSAVLVLAVLCGFSTSALAARPATDEERELILDVFDSSLTPDRWRCYDVIVSTVNERWAAIHIATYESGARVCPNSTGDGHAAYHYIYGGWEENWQASEPPICEQYGMPGAVGRDLGRDGVALCAPTRGTYCGSYGDHGDGETRWAMTPTFGAGIFNVITKRVACRRARLFTRRYRGAAAHAPKWRCREYHAYEYSRVKCRGEGGRVVRWETGA